MKGALPAIRAVAGTDHTLRIGSGVDWPCILNAAGTESDYEAGGRQVEKTLTAVGDPEEFELYYPNAPETYIGNTCITWRDGAGTSETWRVASVSIGDGAAELQLVGEEEAP